MSTIDCNNRFGESSLLKRFLEVHAFSLSCCVVLVTALTMGELSYFFKAIVKVTIPSSSDVIVYLLTR
jgi:hypothetical protein